LDLQSVNIIDAHGLGVLLELRERSLARGMCFELMNVSKPLREILRITRLNTVFQINPGIEFFPWALFARRPRVVAAGRKEPSTTGAGAVGRSRRTSLTSLSAPASCSCFLLLPTAPALLFLTLLWRSPHNMSRMHGLLP